MTPTAAVWSGHGFSIREMPWPDLAEGEVLVEVEMSTVCGSDLHTVGGHRSTPVPTILGHESVGRVVQSNGQATVGDRVVWTVGTSCGACRRCLRGIPQKCLHVRKYGHEAMTDEWSLNGGFASHVHLLNGTGIVAVPEHLPAGLLAPAGCATATITCAARRVNLDAGDAVVVLGCGMLGLTAVAYARDRGAASVLACDPDPARRRQAMALGADAACSPDELTTTTATFGVDVVFEVSGQSSSVSAALAIVELGGRIALVGSVFPGPSVDVNPERIVRDLVTVVGSHNYALPDLVEAVDFLGRTAALSSVVGPPRPLRDIEATFSGEGYPRSALVP
ncbi:alcohol dehydrogenase [Rhodococcoides trifolii]|uniref:alcohol dehydrogenase n=1 Tax=Rhodococcoides trifolii TaxID=908250 RepID=A0A917LHF1_9NOCA|nr:zinc-binding dehydrogenase [Rhodococcus trifolii]GGG24045.1 alcohol dehydrogenase [Rhodococcus trifolii]